MSKGSQQRWLIIAAGFTTAVFLMGCWYFVRVALYNDELGSKVEWSYIQAIASKHADDPSDKIEIVNLGDYSVVGIPVLDTRKRIWIMLNPRNAPYYKQGPTGVYTLSKEDFKKIMASGVVISTVENCLESHVEAPK